MHQMCHVTHSARAIKRAARVGVGNGLDKIWKKKKGGGGGVGKIGG